MGGFLFWRKFSIAAKHKLLHRAKLPAKKPVNNSLFKLSETPDSIGGIQLFAGCSRAVFSEQAVHINSLSVRGFEL
jgi:hypothetical protein